MKSYRHIHTLTALALFGVLVAASNVQGAPAPQAVLTWRANTFFPSDYPGKVVPSPGASVMVSAETLKGNLLADAPRATFTWYLDEHPFDEGVGLKEVMFTAARPAGGAHFVRVEVDDGSVTYLGSVRIPVAPPKIVVDIPAPFRTIAVGSEVTLSAIPLSFNVASLNNLEFTWIVSGERKNEIKGNSLTVKAGVPAPGGDSAISITAIAVNRSNQLESARASVELIVKGQGGGAQSQ